MVFVIIFFMRVAILAAEFMENYKCERKYNSNSFSKGSFTSPSYPQSYPSNKNCTYEFNNYGKQYLRIQFRNIELFANPENSLDDTNIFYVDQSSKLIRQQRVTDTLKPIITNDKKFVLYFVAHENTNGSKGFEADFEFMDNICDELFRSDYNKSGELLSPLYPYSYPERVDCTYEFIAMPNEKIQIIFHDFDLYKSTEPSVPCEDTTDSTLIYMWYDEEIKLCGKKIPLPIMSADSNKLTLTFNGSSPPPEVNYRGFNATYRFITNFGIESGEQQKDSCKFHYNSEDEKTRSGIINSPNFPGQYPKNMRCQFVFYGSENDTLELNFSHFGLQNSSCEDPIDSESVILTSEVNNPTLETKYCGNRDPFMIQIPNATYYRIIFTSKSNNDRFLKDFIGFRAEYKFTNSADDSNGVHLWAILTSSVVVIILSY